MSGTDDRSMANSIVCVTKLIKIQNVPITMNTKISRVFFPISFTVLLTPKAINAHVKLAIVFIMKVAVSIESSQTADSVAVYKETKQCLCTS